MLKNIKGTTDFYPEDESVKQAVFNTLASTAKKFGFSPVTTPIIESFELLSKKQGDEIRSQIFTLEKKGDEDIAMRAEFTPSFARLFIQRQKNLAKPVKWFCIDRVWRYEKPQSGRLREFYQFNVELYGSSEAIADAEIISLAVASLKNLGLREEDFVVEINSRKIIQGITEDFGCKNSDELVRAVDKKKKVSADDFKEMLKEAGVNDVEALIKLLETRNINEFNLSSQKGKEGIEEIKKVLELLPYKCVKFSPATARGLSYYTGTVFEIFDKEGKFRSICGGGRYDSMIESFGGEKTPATGFGMGYATLSLLLEDRKLLPKPATEPDFFIAVIDEEKEALKIADELRKRYSVVINLIKRNIANQMKYANSIGAKNVIVIGPEEVKANNFKIKEMKTGKEKAFTLADISSGKL